MFVSLLHCVTYPYPLDSHVSGVIFNFTVFLNSAQLRCKNIANLFIYYGRLIRGSSVCLQTKQSS